MMLLDIHGLCYYWERLLSQFVNIKISIATQIRQALNNTSSLGLSQFHLPLMFQDSFIHALLLFVLHALLEMCVYLLISLLVATHYGVVVGCKWTTEWMLLLLWDSVILKRWPQNEILPLLLLDSICCRILFLRIFKRWLFESKRHLSILMFLCDLELDRFCNGTTALLELTLLDSIAYLLRCQATT